MIFAEEITQTSQAITFAAIAAFVTILTLVLNNRTKTHADKRINEQINLANEMRLEEKVADRQADIDKETRDYARQDLVAERVEKATRMTLRKLGDVEDLGKVTHALVNSDKTAQMKDQRDDWIVRLALMKEVVSLKEAVGRVPSEDAIKAVEALEIRIQTLDSQIADRLAQQLAAEQRVELDLAQAEALSDAADRQILAAQTQQAAADSQQLVADQITAALDPSKLKAPEEPSQ